MSFWALRILFIALCITAGYAVSAVRPDLTANPLLGALIGFGFGGLLVAIDEMVKGLSLRAFSAASFGLMLGSFIAWLIDNSGLFDRADEATRWLVRLGLFLGFSYIGMILAMRSNKEDFSLIIPYVRFAPTNRPDNLLLFDTSVIIDGRIADLIDARFLEGIIVVPRFVLRELQQLADSADAVKRARGRRGLDILSRIRDNVRNEVKVHEADIPEEHEVDAKLIRLARVLGARLYTNDYNLGKVAELQSVWHVNLNELAGCLRAPVVPGETHVLKIVREGKDRGQGVGFLGDGTMVVVNHAQTLVGQQAEVQVSSVLPTGAGKIVFAELKAKAA
jgi:uncharacterized protein YacL